MPTLNDTTGLPEVPDGYFWRVKWKWEEFHDTPTLAVQLRKRRRVGSKNVRTIERNTARGNKDDYEDGYDDIPGERWRYYRKFATPEMVTAGILSMAQSIMEAEDVTLRREREYSALKSALDKASGDYPPKSLKEV